MLFFWSSFHWCHQTRVFQPTFVHCQPDFWLSRGMIKSTDTDPNAEITSCASTPRSCSGCSWKTFDPFDDPNELITLEPPESSHQTRGVQGDRSVGGKCRIDIISHLYHWLYAEDMYPTSTLLNYVIRI